MRILQYTGLLLLMMSCTQETPKLKQGYWRVTLHLQKNKALPFIMEVHNNNTLTIHNAAERILVDEIRVTADTVTIQVPVFEGIFKGTLQDNGKVITGNFIKPNLNRIVPFTMKQGEKERFSVTSGNQEPVKIEGNWEAVFNPEADAKEYVAKGIFKQEGEKVTGTFRTTTGDYRYLEGIVQADQLFLSTFNGATAFLFEATVTDSTMKGVFYSGNHWKSPFIAKRNEGYELPDANSMTYIKEEYDNVSFTFPDDTGKIIDLQDKRFENKVILVQIMGTWCPNSMDESRYYVHYLKEHPDIDLEIVGLAFEYAPTQKKAFASIRRLKERLEIPYPILLAQYGSTDKVLAREKLPMLNHIISYPTSIFIDKKGKVRRVHTGFNGPATGEKHEAFKGDFEAFIGQLLSE